MKQAHLIIYILLFMTACNTSNQTNLTEEINSIQQKQIDDKRLEYFRVELNEENGEKTIEGATVSENAYNDLKELAAISQVGFNVQMLPTAEFAENPWAIVNLSVCNIRSYGRHSAELATQAIMGTPVKVYQKVGSWYLVQTPDRYFGWVDGGGIALKSNAELAEWKKHDKKIYNKQMGFAYAEADLNSGIESDLVLLDLLSVIGEEKDFYEVLLPDGRKVFVPQNECVTLEPWLKKELNTDEILKTASKFKGTPYLWGGTSTKMVDCSGFTKTVYLASGVILQRDASQQTLYGELVNTETTYKNLSAGDLVFFGRKATDAKKERVTHVGLCLGNQQFIHASGCVRINSLDKTSELYTEYYETAFVRARQIKGNVAGEGIEWLVENDFYKMILPE